MGYQHNLIKKCENHQIGSKHKKGNTKTKQTHRSDLGVLAVAVNLTLINESFSSRLQHQSEPVYTECI